MITLLTNSYIRVKDKETVLQGIKTDLNTLATAIESGDGGNYFNYVSKSTTYTATTSDNVIFCTGTFTITLPTAVGNGGKVFNIKNISTGVITVDGYSTQTIDGELTQAVLANDNLTIISNNSNWYIL